MTNKTDWNKRHGFPPDKSNSKTEISKVSKIPMSIINEVYKRGIGAHRENPQSVRTKSGKKDASAPMSRKMSKEQWAISRVYSFANKVEGPKALNHDKDLAKKLK